METKRYESLDRFYKKKFGSKVFKVSIDANFDCPNKDGTKGTGGCIFCTGSRGIGNKEESLTNQFEKVKDVLSLKWKNAKYIPFLEANTNTYASLEKLKKIYEPLLLLKDVVGLAIATRCDAFTEEIYDYLEELSKRTYLSIELGLQSSVDDTLIKLNRGHTVAEFSDCVRELRSRHIDVVVHIINGLPGETPAMMLDTVRYLNTLDIQGIKFHMLYIEEGSRLAELYRSNPFPLLTREEYIKILSEQVELLDENIVIHRLLSGPDNKKLLAPTWLRGKFTNLNAIEAYFLAHDIRQGRKK